MTDECERFCLYRQPDGVVQVATDFWSTAQFESLAAAVSWADHLNEAEREFSKARVPLGDFTAFQAGLGQDSPTIAALKQAYDQFCDEQLVGGEYDPDPKSGRLLELFLERLSKPKT